MELNEQVMQYSSDVTYTAAGVSTTMGLWAWFGENANAIGALGVFIGVLIGVATFAINWVYKQRHYQLEKNKRE